MSQPSRPRASDRDPTRPWAPSPFARLARVQALSVACDGLFAVAVAGTVFALDQDAARGEVARLLVFTIAPFAVAAPLVGPLIDRIRGGRKWMITAITFLRVVIAYLLIGNLSSWTFYPLGLLMLVLSRGYVIARGAFVPTVVPDDAELVRANSRLTMISGVFGAAGAIVALPFAALGGPGWVLGVLMVVAVVGTVLAVQLPSTQVAAEPADAAERAELRSGGIRTASWAVMGIRTGVGFLTFLLLFHLRETDQLLVLGVVMAAAQIGFLAGAFTAPRLRTKLSEEQIIMLNLGVTFGTALVAAAMGDAFGAVLLSFGIGLTGNAAKQAFDALVQRDAPDANRGRAFARFEVRFQLSWVAGALVSTALGLPLALGFLALGLLAGGTLVWYRMELRGIALARRRQRRRRRGTDLTEPRAPDRSFLSRRNRRRAAGPPPVAAPPPAAPFFTDPDATTVDPTGVDPTLVQPVAPPPAAVFADRDATVPDATVPAERPGRARRPAEPGPPPLVGED